MATDNCSSNNDQSDENLLSPQSDQHQQQINKLEMQIHAKPSSEKFSLYTHHPKEKFEEEGNMSEKTDVNDIPDSNVNLDSHMDCENFEKNDFFSSLPKNDQQSVLELGPELDPLSSVDQQIEGDEKETYMAIPEPSNPIKETGSPNDLLIMTRVENNTNESGDIQNTSRFVSGGLKSQEVHLAKKMRKRPAPGKNISPEKTSENIQRNRKMLLEVMAKGNIKCKKDIEKLVVEELRPLISRQMHWAYHPRDVPGKKGIFHEKPTDWPVNTFFASPSNGIARPSKEQLAEMCGELYMKCEASIEPKAGNSQQACETEQTPLTAVIKLLEILFENPNMRPTALVSLSDDGQLNITAMEPLKNGLMDLPGLKEKFMSAVCHQEMKEQASNAGKTGQSTEHPDGPPENLSQMDTDQPDSSDGSPSNGVTEIEGCPVPTKIQKITGEAFQTAWDDNMAGHTNDTGVQTNGTQNTKEEENQEENVSRVERAKRFCSEKSHQIDNMIVHVRKLSLHEFNEKSTKDILECKSPKSSPGLIITQMSGDNMFKEATSYIGQHYPYDRSGVRLLVAAIVTKCYRTERDMEKILGDLLATQPNTSPMSGPSEPTEMPNVEKNLGSLNLSPENEPTLMKDNSVPPKELLSNTITNKANEEADPATGALFDRTASLREQP